MPKRFAILILWVWPMLAEAEFYVWFDEDGTKHVSNVAPECIKGSRERRYVDSGCRATIDPNRQLQKEKIAVLRALKPDMRVVIGTVLQVLENGILLKDVRLGKNIDDGRGGNQEGPMDLRFKGLDFENIEGNVFVLIDNPEQYLDGSAYEGLAIQSGSVQYKTVLGATATVASFTPVEKYAEKLNEIYR